MTARQAARRIAPGRHNIWEYTLHAAYWKYVVLRRIAGEKRGLFVLKGSNFFPRPEGPSEAAWKKDIEILRTQHQDLRRAVLALSPPRDPEKWRAMQHLIRCAAAHDLSRRPSPPAAKACALVYERLT